MNTILIIDDSPDDIRLLGKILQDRNFHIIFSLNGHDGFQRACILKPVLILLDRMMPEIDGFKICRLLKNDVRTATIPVIFLTAMDSIDDKVEGFMEGACDYVTKPFHPQELIMRINVHIQLHNHYQNSAKDSFIQNISDDVVDFNNLSRAELRVRKAQSVYLNDFTTNPSLADVAKKVGTHARQLSNDFVMITGKNIPHWLQEKRMESACNLLLASNLDINRIAENVGYTSAATFSNTFSDYFGMSPKKYRTLIGLSSDPSTVSG